MKKYLFLLGCLFPGLAWGQGAVLQTGSITNNSPVMWARDHQIRQAAGAAGGIAGQMVTGGFSAVGNICDYSATTDNASYHTLCLDAVNGALTRDGTSYPLASLGGGNVVGPGSSVIGNIAFFNSTDGQLLKDDNWQQILTGILAPNNKSVTVQGQGSFQTGGILGPLLFNDTAADTMSVIALPGALPSGNATNFQIYPPTPGDKAYLNITALASGGGEERLIIGTEGHTQHYVFSQVYVGTGACRDVDFLDGGATPVFTLLCHVGAGKPSFQLGNEVPILSATSGSGSQTLLKLDSALALQIGEGSAIENIVLNKHVTSVGTTPSLSSCGTTPAIVSATDTKGIVTMGTGGPTSCTVTFAAAYDSAPIIQLTGLGSADTIWSVSSASTTNFVISGNGTDISSKVVMYTVIQ